MGQGDFWLQFNNGKKLDLNNLKSGLNKKDVDKKFYSLFDILDSDNNKVLTADEAGLIYNLAALIAGEDKKLSKAEEKTLFNFLGVEPQGETDLSEFIQNFDKIKESNEGYYEDGTRIVQTTYENGKIETLLFYPDGELKVREIRTPQKPSQSPEFVAGEVKYQIKREYSERAKQDFQEQSMDWILNHVNDNLKLISDFKNDEGKGKQTVEAVLNIFGKSLDDVQQELVDQRYFARQSDLSRYNQKLGGSFTIDKYEKFLETDSKYTNARFWKSQTDELQKGLKSLRNAIQGEINREKLASMQNSSNTIGLADAYNKKVPTQKRNSEEIFAEIFNKYCAGNEQLAQQLMVEIAGDITSSKQLTHEKMLEVADKLEKISQQILKDNLGGETYEGLEKRFQSEYKSLYGKEDYTDYIQERMMKIEGWASFGKIAIITITQILIGVLTGGGSVAAEGVAGAAISAGGRAAGRGLVARVMASQAVKELVAVYGEAKVLKWVQQAMKFLMLTGTVAEDIGIGFIDAATSENGITWEKSKNILQQGKSAAKYIYFGGYLSGPLAQFVGRNIKTSAAVARAFSGGTKATSGAIETTTISADKFLTSMQSKAINFVAGTASLGTEIGAFALLDLATEDVGIADALKGSTDMQVKLKIMNRLLETLLGGLVNKISAGKAAAMPKLDAEIEKALNDNALKNMNIVECKSPNGTLYSIEADGKILCSAKDPNMLVVSLTQYLASAIDMTAVAQEIKEMEKANKPGTTEGTKAPVEVTPETKSAKPEESSSAGKRTNEKISPVLMSEFENYAKENNLQLTISKSGNVVFRDSRGKIVRRVNIDENGLVRDDKLFTDGTAETISDKGLKTDNDFIKYLAANHVSYEYINQGEKFIIRISDDTKLLNNNKYDYYIFENGELKEKRLDCTKDEIGKLNWQYRSGRSRTLNSGANPAKITERIEAHKAAQKLREISNMSKLPEELQEVFAQYAADNEYSIEMSKSKPNTVAFYKQGKELPVAYGYLEDGKVIIRKPLAKDVEYSVSLEELQNRNKQAEVKPEVTVAEQTPQTEQNQPPETTKPKLVSKAEYAEILGMSEKTIDLFISKGNIVTEENGLIDWNNPTNKDFTKYAIELVTKMAAPKSAKPGDEKAIPPKQDGESSLSYGLVDLKFEKSETVEPITETPPPQEPEFYTLEEFAERYGVKVATVKTYVKDGRIKLVDGKVSRDTYNNFKKPDPGRRPGQKSGTTETPSPQKPAGGAAEDSPGVPEQPEPHLVTINEFARMINKYPSNIRTLSGIAFYYKKVNGKTMIDINCPCNKKIIEKFQSESQEEVVSDSKGGSSADMDTSSSEPAQAYQRAKEKVLKELGFYEGLEYANNCIDGKVYSEKNFIASIDGKVVTVFDLTGRTNITEADKKFFSSCDVATCKKLGIAKVENENGLKIIMEEGKDLDVSAVNTMFKSMFDGEALNLINQTVNGLFKVNGSNFAAISEISLKKTGNNHTVTIKMRDGKLINISSFKDICAARFGEDAMVDNLKQIMMEIYVDSDKYIYINNEVLDVISKLDECEFKTTEDIEALSRFVLKLEEYKSSEKPNEKKLPFPQEILESVKDVAKRQTELHEQQQAIFNLAVQKFENSRGFLQANGFDEVISVCEKYLSNNKHISDTTDITYIMNLVEKMSKGRYSTAERQEIANSILGYDAVKSGAKELADAKEYAKSVYGSEDYKYIGEYILHARNIENGRFYVYPSFCTNLSSQLTNIPQREAVEILVKLEKWNSFSESDKRSMTKMAELLDYKRSSAGESILHDYAKNYYNKCDSEIIATSVYDKKKQQSTIFAARAKDQVYRKVPQNEVFSYYLAIEYAMTKLIGKDGRTGIKTYEMEGKKKSVEVKLSYPARVYCIKEIYVFDDFDYSGGH